MTEDRYHVVAPGEGERYEARESVMRFKATARTTSGRFSLMERSLPPGGRMPPPHRHQGVEEAYFILEGEVTFLLDGAEQSLGPGHFVLVPSGVAHTFGNISPEPARLLVLHAPALDAYFAELDALWAGADAPAVADELALMRRHGMEPV